MNKDYSKYLLRYDSQINSFKERYQDLINKKKQVYIDWVNKLDCNKWYEFIRPEAPEKEIEFVTGLLCVLYVEKEIYISFSDKTANKIRRYVMPLQSKQEDHN